MGKHLAGNEGAGSGPGTGGAWGTVPTPDAPAFSGDGPAPGWTRGAPVPVGVTPAGGGFAAVKGLVLGAGAAAVTAYLWTAAMVVTGYQFGFAAIAVGAVIGVAVRFGSRGAAGAAVRGGAVGITLVSMAASELFYARQMYIEWLEIQGVADAAVPLFLPLPDMAAVVVESVSADPVTLLFWLLAAATAWRLAATAGESESPGLLKR